MSCYPLVVAFFSLVDEGKLFLSCIRSVRIVPSRARSIWNYRPPYRKFCFGGFFDVDLVGGDALVSWRLFDPVCESVLEEPSSSMMPGGAGIISSSIS